MTPFADDTRFSGSIPAQYERYLAPILFEPYATQLTEQLCRHLDSRLGDATVLEIAAGTGVATRAMARALSTKVEIVATDFNPAMLDQAAQIPIARPVQWHQADAMQLTFPESAFDAVLCQFGVMFFQDKARAFGEVRRVLKEGGIWLFNSWDCIEQNEFAQLVSIALAKLFPENPIRFMARTPHGYHDTAMIQRDLAAGGFVGPASIATITMQSRARSAREVAVAFCQGTPIRSEIEARDATALEDTTDAVAEELERHYGSGAIEGRMRAHVVAITK